MEKIQGKQTAQQIINEIALLTLNKSLKIAAIYAGDDPSTLSYIKSKEKQTEKAGIALELVHLPGNIGPNIFHEKIIELNNRTDVQGIIVEKPLPAQIDIGKVAGIINASKDIDCLSYENNGRLISDDFIIAPSTAMAVCNIIKYNNIEINGKYAVIIGRSEIVGKPLALLLTSKQLDNHATVMIMHSRSENMKEHLKKADIIITAIGKPYFLKPDMIGENKPVLIDVGINYHNNRICGDIDTSSYEKSSLYTPVPGGVGPVTVATLFKNLVLLNEHYE